MFKPLSSDRVTTTEYEAKKTWELDDSAPGFTFHAGANLEDPYLPENSPRNDSGTSIRAVYELIRKNYYEGETIYDRIGIVDSQDIDLSTFPTDERAIIYVLKVSSKLYGKRIDPGTLRIETDKQSQNLAVVDDGNGNLLQEGTDTIVGNIFYQTGTLVLTKRPEDIFQLPGITVWPDYTFEQLVFENIGEETAFPVYEFDVFDLLFRDFDIEFDSVVTNYENEIAAGFDSDEFGATTNPTARESDGVPIEELEDGNFRPYVTTAGFYNDDFELIATGKLARPVKLADTTPMTILARFDT
jgi:hypothetical protein